MLDKVHKITALNFYEYTEMVYKIKTVSQCWKKYMNKEYFGNHNRKWSATVQEILGSETGTESRISTLACEQKASQLMHES